MVIVGQSLGKNPLNNMNKIEINCIFCGKRSEGIVWEENGFTGKQCECGLLYVSPRPSLHEIINLYNYKEINLSAINRIQSEFLNRQNSRHRLKLLRKYRGGGRLLEIGPGAGYFLDESRKEGFEPFGVELNISQAKSIQERFGIPLETAPFSERTFSGISFDVICHFDVLSHFYDPISEFRRFYERLCEGGILFFETGNGGDLSSKWLHFIGQLQYPQHLFLFSQKSIERICSHSGFKVIKVYRYSIMVQLAILKIFQWMKRYKKHKIPDKETIPQPGLKRSVVDGRLRRCVLRIMVYLNLFIRYKLGGILPKIGPQTLVIVAQKLPRKTQ